MKTSSKKKNQTEGLLSRTELAGTETEVGAVNRYQIDFDRRKENRALDSERLLALLRSEAPRLFEISEVVGKWVWIRFEDKQPSDVTSLLAEFGFHWNNIRQTWQHPCGMLKKKRTGFDPRKRYRSYFPADAKAA